MAKPRGNVCTPVKRPKDDMSLGADTWGHAVGEDEALAKRFLDGDEAAFDALYRKYHPRVFTVARGILLDREDANDAVQEAFTKIYENLPKFRGGSRLGTWIFRIAVNSAIQAALATSNSA